MRSWRLFLKEQRFIKLRENAISHATFKNPLVFKEALIINQSKTITEFEEDCCIQMKDFSIFFQDSNSIEQIQSDVLISNDSVDLSVTSSGDSMQSSDMSDPQMLTTRRRFSSSASSTNVIKMNSMSTDFVMLPDYKNLLLFLQLLHLLAFQLFLIVIQTNVKYQ